MSDLVLSSATLVILVLGALTGRVVLRVLPPHHRSAETFAFTRTVSSLLVTFTALVLSLLLTSVNSDFKKTDADLRTFAATIIRLHAELVEIGPATQAARDSLRQYTASAIASTWPEEQAPSGTYPRAVAHGPDIDAPNLADLLYGIERNLRHLDVTRPDQSNLQVACLARLDSLLDQRWGLVNEAHSTIGPPFFMMMVFWLVVVFFTFGLSAPGNATAATFVLLVALSVAAAVFVILELDGPLDGLIKVSSEPMRHALAHLDGSPAGP